jgi:hypothetical protein
MTVGQLIEQLKTMPQDALATIDTGEFPYESLIGSIEERIINNDPYMGILSHRWDKERLGKKSVCFVTW